MNKIKLSYSKGKEVSKDLVVEGKKVADSIAEGLILESKSLLNEAKSAKGIRNFFVWEDKGEIKRKAKKANA